MKALVRRTYGMPDVLEITEVDKPNPSPNEVLVHVKASSVNQADWYELTGWLYLFRFPTGLFKPKNPRLGTDFAGVVEAVGADIDHVTPGDRVFGGRSGALAEYVVVKNAVVRMPNGISFEDAAAVPVAGVTALQGLRDHAGVVAGTRVLINGASGGVGAYSIQVAKTLGAHVTAVVSSGKVALARDLGADRVIDYTAEDFSRSGETYDVIFDIAGSRKWSALKRVLARDGIVIIVGGPKGGRLIGPLRRILGTRLRATLSRRRAKFFLAKLTREDMATLADMLEAGSLKSVIDQTFPLDRAAEAFASFGEGHTAGKVVVTI